MPTKKDGVIQALDDVIQELFGFLDLIEMEWVDQRCIDNIRERYEKIMKEIEDAATE